MSGVDDFPASPIAIGTNFYGSPAGWYDDVSGLERGFLCESYRSRVLGNSGATPAFAIATPLIQSPLSAARQDTRVFPNFWINGHIAGQNTINHQNDIRYARSTFSFILPPVQVATMPVIVRLDASSASGFDPDAYPDEDTVLLAGTVTFREPPSHPLRIWVFPVEVSGLFGSWGTSNAAAPRSKRSSGKTQSARHPGGHTERRPEARAFRLVAHHVHHLARAAEPRLGPLGHGVGLYTTEEQYDAYPPEGLPVERATVSRNAETGGVNRIQHLPGPGHACAARSSREHAAAPRLWRDGLLLCLQAQHPSALRRHPARR